MNLRDRKTIKASLTYPGSTVLIVVIESRIPNLEFSVAFHNGNQKCICLKGLIAVQLVAGPLTKEDREPPFPELVCFARQGFARTLVCLESKLQLPD